MNALIFSIGRKIRDLRNEKGMTLGDLAEKIKVSASLISQLERGGVNPSISLLKSIADTLQIPLSALLGEEEAKPDESPYVMKEKERKALTTEGGVKFILLSGSYDLGCEFIYNEWPPGSSTGKEKYVHEGVESGILLEGELEVELEERAYRMIPGDSITFRSDMPHRLNNHGKKLARGIWVNSKPWIFSIK
ncbi:MAG: helix-turn-helix domain-containing protein [Deltaproteobacteria bacterium]|nr:MAG: helix-turn-helix domain-containing protein [Deltaproteobacteria bacterium]